MNLLPTIKNRAKEIHPDLVRIRRHLHAHPELSFKEYETSKFVKAELDKLNVPYTSMADTGIVALIEGKNPDKKPLH